MLMLGLYSAPPSAGGTLLLDCTSFCTDCTITTNAHGFEALNATVQQALAEAFRIYDQPGLPWLALVDGGQVVWEGRLEDPTLYAGLVGSGLQMQALGAWRALTDVPYLALWSTAETTGYLETTAEMSSPYDQSERWTRDSNNRLFVALTKGNTYTLNKAAGLLMGIPNRSTRTIVGIQFALEVNLPTQQTFRCVSFAGDISGALTSGAVEASIVGTGGVASRAYHLILGTPRETCGVDVLCNTGHTYAGETGASYAKVTKVRVVTSSANRINTTLTVNRAAGSNVTATVGSTAGMYVGMELVINSGNNPSEIVIVESITNSTQFVADFVGSYVIGNAVQGFRVTADEIAAHMVSSFNTINPTQLASGTGQIQATGLDLLNETYEDVTIAADVLTRLAGLGGSDGLPWEAGIYEDRRLFFRPQGSASRAWYVDATDLQIARTLEALANAVRATYSDANGRALSNAAVLDATSRARYGLLRAAIASADTTNATLAATIGSTLLADRSDPLPRATIQFDAVYDIGGARYPLWLVRSGDTITIRNLPPNLSTSVDRIRTFYVTHTSYNVFADTLDVEPELPPTTLEVMLARQSEGIR